MTKYGRPVPVLPASNTLAMFGWSIRASACRSASNRATTSRVSMPSLITFSATCRRTGSLLLGEEDDAEPALADLLEQFVPANPRPGPLGHGGDVAVTGRRSDRRRAPGVGQEPVGPPQGVGQPLDPGQ